MRINTPAESRVLFVVFQKGSVIVEVPFSRSMSTAEEQEHRPARSGTPTAWMTLIILATLMIVILFFDAIVCGALRVGLSMLAWNQRAELSIGHLSLEKIGTLQAQGVTVTFGAATHRSSWKSDSIEIQLAPLTTWLGLTKSAQHHLIHEMVIGKSKLLLDQHGEAKGDSSEPNKKIASLELPWISLLPDTVTAGPLDLVIIGERSRLAVNGLRCTLPDRWVGRLSYSEAMIDIGSAHQWFQAASLPANWNGSTLRLGGVEFNKALQLEELTLSPQRDRLEFGLTGKLGQGLLRGDGALSFREPGRLAVTLVGENLRMDSLSMLLKEGEQRAGGTIRQARITFRGDLEAPLEADSSLRLVADDFRWEGRGWDSLRLAATLTGRVFSLSELVIHQKKNEVMAQGESKLPQNWRDALKAPFTASFHAQLDDAGALAALAGPEFAQLSGELEFEGALKGSENKAEGYCNLVSTGMKLRNLPVDWLKGCLLFEGAKTHLSNLEAWSGKDRVSLEGSIENSRPHTYQATAQFDIGNLTKRLAQIGISTASQIGGGAVQGTWSGDGSVNGDSGIFQAKVNGWVSPWTLAGMSGSFEGSYSPGHLYCSKAEFEAENLRLGLQLSASPTRLEAKSIVATKKGKNDPLVQGTISLPVNAPKLWQSGELVSNLVMKDPLDLQLELHGIKVEELAELLGQKTPCTGTLEGKLSASGTPELPEVHSILNIAKLTLPSTNAPAGMMLVFDAHEGRATCALTQESVKNSSLTLQAELPFHLTTDHGALRFAEAGAPVHALATLHATPLSGWLALWGSSAWDLRDALLDGSVKLSGTLDHPSVEGGLTLEASQATLPCLPPLDKVNLPISCTLSKASISGGRALLGTNPVTLAGALEWSSNSLSETVTLTGQDLPFPTIGGLSSRGDADLSLTLQGGKLPILSGLLTIRQLDGSLPSEMTPSFIPPGVVWQSPFALLGSSQNESPCSLQLDLQAKTSHPLPVGAGREAPQLQADLHIKGSLPELKWTGSVQMENLALKLPSGSFVIPQAHLQANPEGEVQIDFTAYGLTKYGFCTIVQNGSILHDTISLALLTPDASVTEADLLLALQSDEISKAAPLAQLPAWARQNALFPTAPSDWMSRLEGEPLPGMLGFAGRSWSMTLAGESAPQPSPIPASKEKQEQPKN